MSQILTCQQLSVGLQLGDKRFPVLEDINFTLEAGKTFAIVGESGCGKSMTALALAGLLPPTAQYRRGSVIQFQTMNIAQQPEVTLQQIRGKQLGMIFQEPMTALNPVMTVGAQIEEVIKNHTSLPRREVERRALEALHAVGIPAAIQCYGTYPHQLSGGMKQRVVIAMAIVLEPAVLIADEPTTALDVTIQAQILLLLRNLQQEKGMAVLLISHDLGVVSQMADDIAVMYAGKVVEQGPSEQIIHEPLHPYTQQLMAAIPRLETRDHVLAVIKGQVPSLTEPKKACPFANRCPHAWSLCKKSQPALNLVEPEHRVSCHLYTSDHAVANKKQPVQTFISKAPREQPMLLGVEQLELHFPVKKGLLQRTVGQVKAVDGVSMKLKQGHTLALVGESGCGKTTLGKAISLLLKPTKGQIQLQQQTILDSHTYQVKPLRQVMQMVFQDPFSSLNPRMIVSQLLSEGLQAHGLSMGAKEQRDFLKLLLQQVGLPADSLQRYPHEFSGGQRQRISIARALAVNPQIIICDEPTSALDLSVQAKILNLLKTLQQEKGLAFLFITHDISVVSYMADEIAVMYLGRIVEQGTTQDILVTPKHPYTQTLLKAVPVVGKKGRKMISLGGEQPSPRHPPQGCHFASRCPKAMNLCHHQYPEKTDLSATHQVKCFLYTSLTKKNEE